MEQPELLDSLVTNWYAQTKDTNAPSTTLKVFDPNTVSDDSLTAMGVPVFVVSNLMKYRKAGGHFKSAEDLRKLYGMTDSIWQSLNQWIRIEPGIDVQRKREQTLVPNNSDSAKPLKERDLNRVDSTWLIGIYGIGPVLSNRIVKYRTLLGGFYSLQQLTEVYNLPAETIKILKERVFVDLANSPVDKLDLNHADIPGLARHPYISFELARAIVSYRDQHGQFRDMEDLKRIHLMDDSTYLKLSPYLDF
ncbi:MAG: hypothetical protein DHS20C17_32030 [Cyclobacteriaceae bacterium]|nr:MAG: hypothetical protein DHS20C17_32030 [Cyclobacteriaceae bacterium]